MFLVKSELSVTTYLFLVFYRSTTLQSESFLKNMDNFLCKQKLVNNCSIPLRQQPQNSDTFSKIQLQSFLKYIKNFLCKQKIMNNRSIPSTHVERKLPIFLINTLLLHIPLLALTDRQNYRETNTFAARGLEELFSFVLLCQFLVLARNMFWFYILLLMYLLQSTIQLWCCVRFFGSGRKQFLVLRTYVVDNTVVRLCSFSVVAGNSSQK